MIITQLSEVIWRTYQDGRASSASQTFREADILQLVKLAYNQMQRLLYQEAKKGPDGDEYYFYSGILSIQRFVLTDANMKGMRRADMTGVEMYRLPKNANFTNIYPVGCSEEEGDYEITQVGPGEENFYAGNPDMDFFKFYVVKGQGVNTYNLPPCVKAVDIESTFDGKDIDVPLDIGFNIATQVLGMVLHVPGFTGKETDNSFASPQVAQLKYRMQQQQQQPLV